MHIGEQPDHDEETVLLQLLQNGEVVHLFILQNTLAKTACSLSADVPTVIVNSGLRIALQTLANTKTCPAGQMLCLDACGG